MNNLMKMLEQKAQEKKEDAKDDETMEVNKGQEDKGTSSGSAGATIRLWVLYHAFLVALPCICITMPLHYDAFASPCLPGPVRYHLKFAGFGDLVLQLCGHGRQQQDEEASSYRDSEGQGLEETMLNCLDEHIVKGRILKNPWHNLNTSPKTADRLGF